MMIWLSAFASIIPMSLYLVFLRNMDKFEKEPLKLVIKHFIWGATGAIFFAVIGSEFLAFPLNSIFTEPSIRSLLMAVLVAPLVEETTKGVYLFKTAKGFAIDNITDGLVYGGAIGLGFGMTENFFYFLSASNSISSWVTTVVLRTTFSAVMHSIATASFGAFIAMRKFSNNRKRNLLPFIGFLIAILIHFLWNISVSFSFTSIFGYLFLLLVIAVFFIVFKLSLKNERQIIETELKDENIPSTIITELLSITKNEKKRIDQSANKEYISLAVKLAFRKRQLLTVTAKDRIFYSNDILRIREELKHNLIILNLKDNNEQ